MSVYKSGATKAKNQEKATLTRELNAYLMPLEVKRPLGTQGCRQAQSFRAPITKKTTQTLRISKRAASSGQTSDGERS